MKKIFILLGLLVAGLIPAVAHADYIYYYPTSTTGATVYDSYQNWQTQEYYYNTMRFNYPYVSSGTGWSNAYYGTLMPTYYYPDQSYALYPTIYSNYGYGSCTWTCSRSYGYGYSSYPGSYRTGLNINLGFWRW